MKLALPKGELQRNTAKLLSESGYEIPEYCKGSRSYRPRCEVFPGLFIKVFHEKDIAIQVAIGNYDLGICRRDWVEELLAKYRSDAVVKLRDLGYGGRKVYAVVGGDSEIASLDALRRCSNRLRIVSEYPNIAESFALKQRLRRFQILPVWGAASVYLPQNAEIAIVAMASANRLRRQGLAPVSTVLGGGACLIANRNSLERKDLSGLLSALPGTTGDDSESEESFSVRARPPAHVPACDERVVSLALPDGHQQRHVVEFLNRAQIEVDGYNLGEPTARPRMQSEGDGFMVKVIRPQDMPLQVANGSFDLAITGRDWLRDHRHRFPLSPVEEILELGFGKVRIVAVVTQDTPVSNTQELRKLRRDSPLRVASEYVNIADRYAHDYRLAPYKLVPTWGASEAFLPEDADVLIENTETGSTIARNKLKIIDTLFESTACLIGNSEAMRAPETKERIGQLIERMRGGIETCTVS